MNNYAAFFCLIDCFIPNILFILEKPHQSPGNSVRFTHTDFDFSASLFVTPSYSKAKLCKSKADKNFDIQHCTEVKTMTESTILSGSGFVLCAFFNFF